MKKLLVITAVMVCLLMALVSCAAPGETNDPKANIDHLLSTFNQDLDLKNTFDSLQTNTSMPELEFNFDPSQIPETIKGLELEVSETHNVNGVPGENYLGIKDNVAYLKGDITANEGGYIFFEDDLTIVAVDEKGNNGHVEESLKVAYEELMASMGSANEDLSSKDVMDMIEQYLGSADLSDVIGMDAESLSSLVAFMMGEITMDEFLDENKEIAEVFEQFEKLQFPQLTAEMVKYESASGRYYLSDDYIIAVVNTAIDFIADMSGEVVPPAEIQAVKDGAAEYIDAFNLSIYFYLEYEEFVGFGFAVNPQGDILEMLGTEKLSFAMDVTKDSFDLDVKTEADGSDISVELHYKNVYNSKKELTGCSLEFKGVLPQNIYAGSYDGYVMYDTVVDAKIELDTSKIENNGEFASVKVKYNEENFRGFIWDMSKYDYKEDPSFVDTYSKDAGSININVKAVSSQGGDKIAINAEADVKNIDGEDVEANFAVNISAKVEKFPAVPANVIKTKEDALKEYKGQ